MRAGFFAAALALVAMAASAGEKYPFPSKETSLGKVYEIDGKKYPGLIPQHDVWTRFFHDVGSGLDANNEPFLRHIGVADLSPHGAEILRQAVTARRKGAEQCGWLVRSLAARLLADKAPLDVQHKESCDALVKCRQYDIDSGERLLSDLTPEDQAIISEQLEAIRHSVSLLVFERDMDCYALPR